MQFSDPTGNTGILERARKLARVDATQYPTSGVVNSCNDRLDLILNYGRGADRKFQLDDTNHTKLPQGTTNLTAGQADYSFLTDEQGNRITNLTRIDILDANGNYRKLEAIDQSQINGSLDEFYKNDGAPLFYDKIADNVIRLYPTPDVSVTAGIVYYFQRTPSYFTETDTTKEPGFANDLHRGFVVQAAYDIALELGLANLQPLSVELQREQEKMENYFGSRNTDETAVMTPTQVNAE